MLEDNMIVILLYSILVEFLSFSTMPLFVQTFLPIRTWITVCLMVFLAVNTLEDMRVRLAFLSSKPWWIHLGVFFAAPCFLPVMLRFMRSIVFNIPRCVWLVAEYWVFLFPAVLTLWNTRIHICAMNGGNILANVELLIDDVLSFGFTL